MLKREINRINLRSVSNFCYKFNFNPSNVNQLLFFLNKLIFLNYGSSSIESVVSASIKGAKVSLIRTFSQTYVQLYVLEVSTGPKFPARPAKVFFGPARNQCIIKILLYNFF